MSKDPHVITLDRVAELLVGLGLDPDMDTLKAVHIEPHGITVRRARVDEQGRQYVVGDEVATETVTIRIGQ